MMQSNLTFKMTNFRLVDLFIILPQCPCHWVPSTLRNATMAAKKRHLETDLRNTKTECHNKRRTKKTKKTPTSNKFVYASVSYNKNNFRINFCYIDFQIFDHFVSRMEVGWEMNRKKVCRYAHTFSM